MRQEESFAPDFKFKFFMFERDHISVRERLCRWGDKFWTCFLELPGYLSESGENYYYIRARNLKLRAVSNPRDECHGFGHNGLIKQGNTHLKNTLPHRDTRFHRDKQPQRSLPTLIFHKEDRFLISNTYFLDVFVIRNTYFRGQFLIRKTDFLIRKTENQFVRIIKKLP